MRRRYTATDMMVDASCVLQETVGMLSNPEKGAAMIASGNSTRRVASRRMRETISRLELVSIPPGLVSDTKTAMMYDVQG